MDLASAGKTAKIEKTLSPISGSERLLWLDLLRGLTIGFMILVNNGGSDSAYWPLKHAEWNGFTPTNLVFPTFLFLVGMSTVLSTASHLARGAADGRASSTRPSFFTPLLVFGTNAIAAYVFSELLAPILDIVHPRPGVNLQRYLFESILSAVHDPAFASLLYSLSFVFVCWLATYVLYRNMIFIKI